MATTVVYDACVLYPATLRDLLIELAVTRLFNAKWTDRIHDEWTRNLLSKYSDLTAAQLEVTRRNMNRVVLDSLVTGYEAIMPAMTLPNPDDAHVFAPPFTAMHRQSLHLTSKIFLKRSSSHSVLKRFTRTIS